MRHIDNPVHELKVVQRAIGRRVLSRWVPPYGMFGAVPGRTLLDNARMHVGREVLVTVDVKDCFPSITNQLVYSALKCLVGAREVAELLTRLSTVNFHLPQGAPTSAMLANMVLAPAFTEMSSRARTIGVAVSSWIDDFAFSGARAPELIDVAYAALGKLGLRLGRQKVRIRRAREATLELTGLVVNRKTSLGRERIGEMRRAIFAARNDGVLEYELLRVRGQLSWAAQMNREQGRALARLAEPRLAANGFLVTRPKAIVEPCTCALGRGMVRAA